MSPQHTASRFLRSSGAAALSQGVRVLSTLGAQLVLRRYIPPEDWGLFQWASVVFLLLGAVRDLGLGYHVLRTEPRPYGNLLALEGLWGGFLFAMACLAAPLGPLLYAGSHEHTVSVLRLMALFMLLEGLATVPRIYLEGELQVGRAVGPELLRNLVFVATACGLATQGFGVFSLAIGHTAATGIYAAILWLRVWREIPLSFAPEGMRRLLIESSPLAIIWFLAILIRWIDPLVLGLRFPFEDVGNYSFAFEWATMAAGQILLPAITRAFYPALLRFGVRSRETFRAYSLSTLFILIFEVPAAFFLFLNADRVVLLVGGGQWSGAPTYLRILAFAPLVDPFTRLGGEMMKALHWDRLWIAASLLTVLAYGGGGYLLTGVLGPAGMAWINLLPLGSAVIAWAVYRVSPEGFRALGRQLLFVYLAPVPLFAAAFVLAGADESLRLALSLLAGALAVLASAWRFGAEFQEFFRGPSSRRDPGDSGA
ncbi:MAG: oligosaccharide flippase family protein [Acidobacteriota bacterium]